MDSFAESFLNSFTTWLNENVLNLEALYQIIGVVVFYIIAILLTSKIKKLNKTLIESENKFSTVFGKIVKTLIKPIIFLLLLLLFGSVLESLDLSIEIVSLVTSLMSALVIIRIISLSIEKKIWRRTFEIFVWLIVALHISGLKKPVFDILEEVSFNLGEVDISILSIIKGAIFLSIALWIAKQISSLIENKIKQTEHINPSAKVLITKSIKIVFIFIATLIALNSIGIKLTTFAVFSGAIGVGIGFGLQKSVSNFISGIILLLDRSIKPGDVIEINDTYGWIKSMKARYITVVTINGREILIPNEDLITQKVINWSYSDKNIRINVGVGVSYNADIDKAMELIIKAARSIKRIQAKPEPMAFLKGFGSSSVDLEVHFWISDPETGLENIKSEVRKKIWHLFKENEVEIPFPQQDLHLKDLPPNLLNYIRRK